MIVKLHGPLTVEQVYIAQNLFKSSEATKDLIAAVLELLNVEAAARVVELHQIQQLSGGGKAEFYKNVGARNQLGAILKRLNDVLSGDPNEIGRKDGPGTDLDGGLEAQFEEEEMAARDAFVGLPPLRTKTPIKP